MEKMKAVRLPANNCFAVKLGDNLIGIGEENKFLFQTNRELIEALNRVDLTLDGEANVVCKCCGKVVSQ